MPIVSKAQSGAMHAAAQGDSTLGIPQKVGKEFVAAGPKGGSFAKLPKKVGKIPTFSAKTPLPPKGPKSA